MKENYGISFRRRIALTIIASAVLGLFEIFGSAKPAFANRQSAAQFDHPVRFELITGVKGQKVYLASNLNDWQVEDKFQLTENTKGIYTLTIEEPWLPQLIYKFVVDGKWINDPTNDNSVPDGHGGINSAYDTTFQLDPLLELQEGNVPFQYRKLNMTDYLGENRQVSIIFPAKGLEPNSVTLYFQDGGDYLSKTGVANLIANLSQTPGLPQFVGVFIPPKDRDNEYGFTRKSEGYIKWVAEQVVAKIEHLFSTGGAPTRRLLIGPSMGGLITLQTSLQYPNIFPYVASQSGSIWVDDEKLLPIIRSINGGGMKWFLDVGLYEGSDMLSGNQKAFNAAQRAGIDTVFKTYPTTHDWYGWQNRMQEIILHFFPISTRQARTPR